MLNKVCFNKGGVTKGGIITKMASALSDKQSEEIIINRGRNSSFFMFFIGLMILFFLSAILVIGSNNIIVQIVCVLLIYLVPLIIFGLYLKKYVYLGIFYSCLYVFQNIMIGLGSNFFDRPNFQGIQVFIAMISLFGFLILCFLMLNSKNVFNLKHEKIGLMLMGLTLLYFFIGPMDVMTSAAYARNLFLIALLPVIGKVIIQQVSDLNVLIKYLFGISLFVVLFGLFESLLFSHSFWYDFLNVDVVLLAKGFTIIDFERFPPLWYTIIFEHYVRRMASVFMEPVNLSYYLVVPTIIAFSLRKWLIFVILLLGVFLTFGKGGWLVLLISISSIYLLKRFKKTNGFIPLVFFITILTIILSFAYFKISPGTALPHLWGMMSIEKNLISEPLGHGLGSGGNFNSIFNDTNLYDTLHTGAESGIATLVYKLGLPGFLLFFLFLISLGNYLVNIFLLHKDEMIGAVSLATSGLVLGMLFGSVFQENPLGPQTNHMILIMAGAVIGVQQLIDSNKYPE